MMEEGGRLKWSPTASEDVLKEEVLQTSNLKNCAKRTTSSINRHPSHVKKSIIPEGD
jgi:hypothetical protein